MNGVICAELSLRNMQRNNCIGHFGDTDNKDLLLSLSGSIYSGGVSVDETNMTLIPSLVQKMQK